MDNFPKSLEFSLRWEGGFSDHPADHGGATMRGITQATYDAYLRSIGAPSYPVKGIRDEEIEWIYRRNYWEEIRGDSLPSPLSIAVFDCAVNSGPSRSIKLLQAACNGGLIIDGAIGPKTIAAAQGVAVGKVIDQREAFLRRIVVRDPSQQVFLKGWLNRIAALRVACNGG
jgi:lysozyme family protein